MSKKDPLKGVPQISENKLKTLVKTAERSKAKSRAASGELGQAIAKAVENDHLHRKAFATLNGVWGMENEALAEWWYTFQNYAEMSGLLERIESVPSLKLVHDADKKGDEQPQTQAAE